MNVLLVDDDKEILLNLKKIFNEGHVRNVYLASNIDEMFLVLKKEVIDVVLLDNHLGEGVKGHLYINEIKALNPTVEVIMLTSDNSIELVIASIKKGAFYFLVKDKFEKHELLSLTKKASDLKRREEERQALSDSYTYIHENELNKELIGDSKYFIEVKSKIEKLATSNLTNSILFVGEKGVGKTELARYFYSIINSGSQFRPLFRIKARALKLDNIEKILFGDDNKKGILEISSKSVLLLEEIGDLHKDVQGRILSLLNDKNIYLRNGEKRENRLTIISTSSIDLNELADKKILVDELFDAVSSIYFVIKPIRDRISDLEKLIQYFMEQFSLKYNINYTPLPLNIIDLFVKYEWAGNISELKAVIEKLLVLGYENGQYSVDELPDAMLSKMVTTYENIGDEPIDKQLVKMFNSEKGYHEKVILFKKLVVMDALKKSGNNVKKAALILNEHRTVMYRRISELNIKILEKE